MKTLVVINGVTGAIGNACLAKFSRMGGATIIGLSRQAIPIEQLCEDGKLGSYTTVCAIGDISDEKVCRSFVSKINATSYERIFYIHCVGEYPVELDEEGRVNVSHDADGDGIDDRVVKLSHDAFFAMTTTLRALGLPVSAIIFGGIADKYKSILHRSWWTVMARILDKMKALAAGDNGFSFHILNISSIICSHELITRPFIFQRTNADPRFWLMPSEVADKVLELLSSAKPGVKIEDLFHKSNYYTDDYFTDDKFTARKRAELGLPSPP